MSQNPLLTEQPGLFAGLRQQFTADAIHIKFSDAPPDSMRVVWEDHGWYARYRREVEAARRRPPCCGCSNGRLIPDCIRIVCGESFCADCGRPTV